MKIFCIYMTATIITLNTPLPKFSLFQLYVAPICYHIPLLLSFSLESPSAFIFIQMAQNGGGGGGSKQVMSQGLITAGL
jgi:hypothetical protein